MTLEKMPDRFAEHPQMVLVVTNMHYSEATTPVAQQPGQGGQVQLGGAGAGRVLGARVWRANRRAQPAFGRLVAGAKQPQDG